MAGHLYLIGLGLGGAEDMTVRGIQAAKSCDVVYIDAYTSLFCNPPTDAEDSDVSVINTQRSLEKSLNCVVIPAFREDVEQKSDDEMLARIEQGKKVAFLVVGDPLGATTHMDLILRAIDRGLPYSVVHNTSILTAAGVCGLQLYRFGETISLPLWSEVHRPESFLDRLLESNLRRGLHSLCLLDIRVREPTLRALMRQSVEGPGATQLRPQDFEPPRYMRCHEAAGLLCRINALRRERAAEELSAGEGSSGSVVTIPEDILCVGMARVGSETQRIVVATLKELATAAEEEEENGYSDLVQFLGGPLHCMAVCGTLHELEVDMLLHWRLGQLSEQHKQMDTSKEHFHCLLKAHRDAVNAFMAK